MILNDGTEWEPETEDILKWQSLYPAIDVYQELNGMAGWLDANPKKRKSPRGIKRFVNAWLQRAQDKGGSPHSKDDGIISKTRQMSSLDDLTHDFMNSPTFRESCLAKYGQYFSRDGKRVTA